MYDWDKPLLGKYWGAFRLRENADHTVDLIHNDKPVCSFSQYGMNVVSVQDACEKHLQK
jgi:hypothetical protein